MKESFADIDELIIGYLTDEITEEDKSTLLVWLNESGENKKYYYCLSELWRTYMPPENLAKYDKIRAFELFKARVAAHKAVQRKRRMTLFRYAATFLILFSVSILAFNVGQRSVKSSFSDIVIEAPRGASTRTSLPDGSNVWLNAGSKITYSQGFGVDDRCVKLEGEGYFEVKKNEGLPFSVTSDNLKVTVLGTKFDFSDYPDDGCSYVSLNEGSVDLRGVSNNGNYLMEPDQRVIFNKRTGVMAKENHSAKDAMQWIDGLLVFNGESFEIMAKKLERKYNVSITIAQDSIRKLRFYGKFNTNEQNIADVLNDLSRTNHIHCSTDKGKIVVY